MTGLTPNALGRLVPDMVNGRREVPFQGVHGHRPAGRKAAPAIRSAADYPATGDKRVGTLAEALEASGLRDGMLRIHLQQLFERGDPFFRTAGAEVDLCQRHVGGLVRRRLLQNALQKGDRRVSLPSRDEDER